MNCRALYIAGLFLVLTGIGCREREPHDSFDTVLEVNGKKLLPTLPAYHEASIADGTAEWVAFKDPTARAAAKPPASSGTAKADGAVDPAAAQAILDTVADFNDVIKEKDYDEALNYLVEAQIDTAQELFALDGEASEALEALIKAITDKSPALEGRADDVRAQLDKPNGLLLSAGKVNSLTDDEAVLALNWPADNPMGPMLPKEFRVVKVEADWYIEHPIMEIAGQMIPVIKASAQQISQLASSVDSGELEPEVALQTLEATAGGPAGAAPTPDADSQAGTPPEVETDSEGSDEADDG